MTFKFTALVSGLVALILAVGVKMGDITGCYYSTIYISRPCSIINLCVFLLVFAFAFDFYIGIIRPRIKNYLSNKTKKLVLIKEDNIRASVFTDSYKGFYSGVGIRVFNKSDFEVSECFGTLEELHIVVIENGKLKELPNTSDGIGMEVSKKLLWANVGIEDTSCKVNIPAKSKENIILVAGIFDELVFERKKNKEKLKETNRDFRFTFCKGGTQYSNRPCLYKVKIRVNAKSKNSPDITEYFERYIYSYIDKTSPDSDSVIYNVLWIDDPLQYRKILSDPRVVIRGR